MQFPDTATFLKPEEKMWLTQTLKKDTVSSSKALKQKFLVQALRDPHAYLWAVINFLYVGFAVIGSFQGLKHMPASSCLWRPLPSFYRRSSSA